MVVRFWAHIQSIFDTYLNFWTIKNDIKHAIHYYFIFLGVGVCVLLTLHEAQNVLKAWS